MKNDPRPSTDLSHDLRPAAYQPPAIDGDFRGKHIVTVEQFAKEDLDKLFETANDFKRRLRRGGRQGIPSANGHLLALLFFESSTRTDMSFQAAMRRLGGEVVGVSNGIRFSSVYKGENLADTVRAAGCYADIITLRHPEAGASRLAAYYLDMLAEKIGRRPVLISGGDGTGEHPTQALLDLFTILESKGSADNLSITMVGDLKYGRTVHSLAKLLAIYRPTGTTINFVSPRALRLPEAILAYLKKAQITVEEEDRLDSLIGQSDVIYWTRIQEERFASPAEYDKVKDRFIMTPGLLDRAKPQAVLMHPLPRKHEMGGAEEHHELDRNRRSIYFQQMENGMLVRMALLARVLDILPK